MSCSKTLLVDVCSRRNPRLAKHVYAIVDEQSNSSLVTSELADDLGADGPLEKYFLSTWSGEKEEKYGRRVAGITVRSLSGAKFSVPTLIECDTIPQDKRKILNPDMARSFPHLKAIAPVSPAKTVSFWRYWRGVNTRTQEETGRCPYRSVTSARLCRTIEFKLCSACKGFSRHLPGNLK